MSSSVASATIAWMSDEELQPYRVLGYRRHEDGGQVYHRACMQVVDPGSHERDGCELGRIRELGFTPYGWDPSRTPLQEGAKFVHRAPCCVVVDDPDEHLTECRAFLQP